MTMPAKPRPFLPIAFLAAIVGRGCLFAAETPEPGPFPGPAPSASVTSAPTPAIPGAGVPTTKPSTIKRPTSTPEVQPGTSPSGMSVTPEPLRPLDPLLGSASPLQRPLAPPAIPTPVPVPVLLQGQDPGQGQGPSPGAPLTVPAPVERKDGPR